MIVVISHLIITKSLTQPKSLSHLRLSSLMMIILICYLNLSNTGLHKINNYNIKSYLSEETLRLNLGIIVFNIMPDDDLLCKNLKSHKLH